MGWRWLGESARTHDSRLARCFFFLMATFNARILRDDIEIKEGETERGGFFEPLCADDVPSSSPLCPKLTREDALPGLPKKVNSTRGERLPALSM